MKKNSERKTLKPGESNPQTDERETAADAEESDAAAAWESDQKKRGYYYDDAHGYEIYDPEKDDEEDED